MRSTTKATVARARTLRREMTRPEARLWQVLRTRLGGLKFRRQHPIGPYVLDFCCAGARLAVEIDGTAHNMGNNPQRDIRRDVWLSTKGVQGLRIVAAELYGNIEVAILTILAACTSSE